MSLILWPSLKTATIEQLEACLESARGERTLAAIEYVAGEQLQLSKSRDKLEQKLGKQYDMLGKEIAQLDKILEKLSNRLATIALQKNEIGLITSLIDED